MVSGDLGALARNYALQNAVQHDGRADAKSCMGRVMGAHPELRSRAGEVQAALEAAVAEVNAMDAHAQRAELEEAAPELVEKHVRERRSGLKPLPDAEPGKTTVVLRFAPNPNGPLSLGHSRGVAIMAEYARQYDADLVLRFDDTDPQVKPPLYDPGAGADAYQWILEDFRWLTGRAPDRIVKASDRLEVYHARARELILVGGAYVCTCDAEAWRDMKNQGHPCPHRDIGPEALVKAFEKMVAGGYKQGEAVLRIKTDIQHKDPALRDWTAFRVVADAPVHPREAAGEIGHHVCWPLLDFESAVEDHEQGVTHVIRGKDLMDSTRKQQFLYDHMGWTYPKTLYWGRVKVHEFGRFSTSMMRQGIEEGRFEGWDDLRLPTLRALRRRGYRADALARFWIDMGLTEKDIAVSMENLEAANGKAIDDETPRYAFIPDPRPVTVRDLAGREAHPPIHPNHPDRGTRTLAATETVLIPGADAHEKQLRLKDLGNILIAGGSAFYTGDTLDRALPIIQWLPKELGKPFAVLRPDGDHLRRDEGLVEPAALEHVGAVVQFERYGFVRIEDEARGVWLHE